jgi:glucose-1-phosphate thymidylyltransferase
VALGFPDIIFEPEDAFVQVLNKQAETQADVVLGVFRTDEPQKWDMIDMDEHGQIRKIVIKPPRSNLTCTWALAVWSPSFSEFMHQYLAQSSHAADRTELHVGNVIQAAIDDKMHVEGVFFPHGRCLDIGTPDDLIRAVRAGT